ncbi:spermatogenesis-associated protein 31E1 [Arvicola amphibius]|uniref:spermatogenesis-associated protein 31E1 n=1 Tax=Arvicola amphibius TaxID=1047088 RepID=UPI001C086157|nr:spermatogenesis-associated protein 31E1 [Arvicola amphibius]
MENSLLQLSSISDYWMSLSSIVMAKDMIVGVTCGAGLFFLLIPFLKKYPASPPPGNRMNPPKVRKALIETQWSVFSLFLTTVTSPFHSQAETAERNSPETAAPHLQGLETQRAGSLATREEEWAQVISVLSHCQVVRRGRSRTRKKIVSAKGRLLFPSGEAIPSALSSVMRAMMRATLLRYGMQSTEKRRLLGRKSESGKLPRFCERRKLGLEWVLLMGQGGDSLVRLRAGSCNSLLFQMTDPVSSQCRGRDGRKKVEETQNASRPVETPIKQPLLDSTSLPIWNSNEKLDQLPLSRLLSYLKVVEDLIQRKCSQVFWGMSSMLSESVVASAWVSNRSSSAGPKTVRFSDTCGPFPVLPMTQGPPQISQAQLLPHQPVIPSLTGVKEAQTLGSLPSSTPNRALSSSRSRVCVKDCSTSETKIQVSLPTENQDLERKDTLDSSTPKEQAGISRPTHNSPGGTLPPEPVRSASIFPEHCQFLQHREGTQSEDKVTKEREIRGSPFTVLSSPELTQLWGHFPANSPCQPKNKPELPQPAQPSILDSKSCKLSQMMGSVPSAMPLKKPAICDIHDPIKEDLGLRANDLPCTSSSSPGKNLEPRKPALRTDQQSYVNTAQDLPFLDPKTQMKLELNIMQLPVKRRRRPTSVSKAEYYSKAAMILEKLHHRDPGGTRVETVSTARLRSPLLAHSPSQIQVIQRATPPAASHGPSKAHPDTRKSYLSTKTRAFCFQARTQQSRTVRGIGRSNPQPRTSPRIYKHAAWMKSENMASGHPCWSGTKLGPQERIPPSVVKQINRSKEKEGTPPAWKVSLGSTEIPSGQVTNIHPRDFESTEANRSPGHFQTPTPRHPGDSALKTQVCSEIDFRSRKQPQSWSVGHRPDSSSSVSLPSEHLLPSFQNRTKKPKTSKSLRDVFVRRDRSQKTQDFRVPKDKIQAKNHKMFYPDEERKEFMRSRAKSQEEQPGRGSSSTLSSTWFKNTATMKTEPSLDMPGIEQTPQESYLLKIIRNIIQYINLSTKDKGQEDSLKKASSPPSTLTTQEKLIYSMATEVHSLMNILVQLLVNWLGLKAGHPSEAQWCKAEPLIAQLRDSFLHIPEGIYEPKNSRPEKISSGPHTSPMVQSHTFMNKVMGDKPQSGIATQETCLQHQNSVKRGMGCEQLPSPKGNNHPCRHGGTGDKQQLGVGAPRTYDSDQIRMKSGMNCCPHTSPKGHNHVFMHRDVGDNQPSGAVHRAFDPHQSTKKGTGCGPLTSSKENNPPVTHRGTGDKEQSPQTDLTSIGLGAGVSGHLGLCAS